MIRYNVLHITILVLLLLSFDDVNSKTQLCRPCPHTWRVFGSSCYLYVEQVLTFDAAETFCSGLSHGLRASHLLSVADEDENSFVANYVNSIDGTSVSYILYSISQYPKADANRNLS